MGNRISCIPNTFITLVFVADRSFHFSFFCDYNCDCDYACDFDFDCDYICCFDDFSCMLF